MHDDPGTGGQGPLVDRSFDPAVTDPVDAVFRAVGEAEHVDLTEAEPLASAVDPDALDAIFGRNAVYDSVEVSFCYAGLEIRLSGDGSIRVIEDAAGDFRSNR